jgi:hypothetical protein
MKRVEAIKARADAATPGPWNWEARGVWTEYEQAIGGPVLDEPGPRDQASGTIGYVGDLYPRGFNHPSENMEFVAHARADVPWLLERAAELAKALATLVRPDNGYCNQCKGRWLYRRDGSWVYADGQHNAWCIGRALLDVEAPNA